MGRIKLGTEAGGGFRNIAISSCVFDHSRGDESYKARFSNGSKRYFTLHVYRRGIGGWARRSALRLKERAKKSPALQRLLRRARGEAPPDAAPKGGAGGEGAPR